MAETQAIQQASHPPCLESVNRISKLPVVESTVQTATSLYEKVKDYNSVTQWTCSTAENVVNKAVEVGKPIAMPIVQGLEGPIKKVDDALCSGLDYVETKVPAVKLPPGEIYANTKEYVNQNVTPKVESAYHYVEPTVKTAYEKIEPAVQSARTAVEPFVQPALDKVQQLKEYGIHKIEEVLGCSHDHPEGNIECQVCLAAARNRDNTSTEAESEQH